MRSATPVVCDSGEEFLLEDMWVWTLEEIRLLRAVPDCSFNVSDELFGAGEENTLNMHGV